MWKKRRKFTGWSHAQSNDEQNARKVSPGSANIICSVTSVSGAQRRTRASCSSACRRVHERPVSACAAGVSVFTPTFRSKFGLFHALASSSSQWRRLVWKMKRQPARAARWKYGASRSALARSRNMSESATNTKGSGLCRESQASSAATRPSEK